MATDANDVGQGHGWRLSTLEIAIVAFDAGAVRQMVYRGECGWGLGLFTWLFVALLSVGVVRFYAFAHRQAGRAFDWVFRRRAADASTP